MKKLHLKLFCIAALLAAIPVAGCTNMDKGKNTHDFESRIYAEQSEDCKDDNTCPDCKDGKDGKDCPDCKDGKDDTECPDNGDCPKPHKRHRRCKGKTIPPKGSLDDKKKPTVPPKRPVAPPEDDDVILPDPPVDGKYPKN